jgi:hypothetical protein
VFFSQNLPYRDDAPVSHNREQKEKRELMIEEREQESKRENNKIFCVNRIPCKPVAARLRFLRFKRKIENDGEEKVCEGERNIVPAHPRPKDFIEGDRSKKGCNDADLFIDEKLSAIIKEWNKKCPQNYAWQSGGDFSYSEDQITQGDEDRQEDAVIVIGEERLAMNEALCTNSVNVFVNPKREEPDTIDT